MSGIDRRAARAGGFTLIESLVASVVLAILVLGVCAMLTSSYAQAEVVRANATGIALARQLADEIASKPLADPSDSSMTLGAGGLTSRSQFTHVTQYDGYSDSSTAAPTLSGETIDVTGGAVYQRSVAVTVGASPSIDSQTAASNFALVTVTVACPTGQNIVITRFVANYPIHR